MPEIKTKAVFTCPKCQTKTKVTMPTEGKQHFFKCTNEQCKANITIKEGECCVFCSYADKPCPSKQANPQEDQKSKLQSLI